MRAARSVVGVGGARGRSVAVRTGLASLATAAALGLFAAPARSEMPAVQVETPVERCAVPPFRNASAPGGAQATMTVVNDGRSCRIVNYIDSRQRTNPDAIRTITRPHYGSVRISQPGAILYRPSPGFIGIDEFAYAATGRSRDGRLVEMTVRVTVKVLAPPVLQAEGTPK
jgi:hypothetical protein